MRLLELTLPDGRALAWSEWGDPDGVPVLFVPGAGTGRLMTFGEDAAARAGICGWTIDRPGLGASQAAPGRDLRSTAEDLSRLLDARGIERVAVLANSQGAPFALHLAAMGRAASLSLVSPIDEFAHPSVRAQLDDARRAFVDRVLSDPRAVEAELARFTADDLVQYIVDSSGPDDQELYRSAAFGDRLGRSMRAALEAGASGYARDTVLATAPWEVDLERIDVPTDIWFGDADAAHSPDLGATLAARMPTAMRRVVRGAGGALLWTHADKILARVLERSAAPSA